MLEKLHISPLAIDRVRFTQVKIPPRSADCNPIENLFASVKKKLRADALERGIRNESFADFEKRVVRTVKLQGKELTNMLISSMEKRLRLILAGKGQRLRY